MSVEYHFFPCKNKRIIGGFVRDENGEFDIYGYDWQAGCYVNGGKFLCLAEVVKCMETMM